MQIWSSAAGMQRTKEKLSAIWKAGEAEAKGESMEEPI